MAQLTYYVAPWDWESDQPKEAMPREVLHGYTIEDIDRLARYVINIDRWYRVSDVRDRMNAIWSAIAEHLCLAAEPPTGRDLTRIGMDASARHVHECMQFRGYSRRDIGAGSGGSGGFQRFWFTANTASHEDRIVERTALDQIWPHLTPREQQALTALAATGDTHLAAAAMGISVDSVETRIAAARRHFLTLWHQGETPSRTWHAKRCSAPRPRIYQGRRRLTESEVEALRRRYHNGERLRALAADAEVGASTLSALFLGKRRPAADVT